MLRRLRTRLRRLRGETLVLWLAARHPQTPWYAKLIVATIVAYLLAPVDFVPDIVPVLGIVDDLIFVPIGVALATRFIPPAVLEECRRRVHDAAPRPKRRFVVVILVGLWLAILAVSAHQAWQLSRAPTHASAALRPQ